MRDKISIIPSYTEDGSMVVFVFDKLDGSPISFSELADAMESYAALLREPSDDGVLEN